MESGWRVDGEWMESGWRVDGEWMESGGDSCFGALLWDEETKAGMQIRRNKTYVQKSIQTALS